jgi:mRNA-capping enzyme
VLDKVNDAMIPRYLIYDIIKFRGEEVGKCDFRIRLNCIRVNIVVHGSSVLST